MSEKNWDVARVARWSGTFGFVLPALTLVVYPIWSFPDTETLATEVSWWATEHHEHLVVTMLLNTIGVTLWLVFGAAVWTYLRDKLPVRSMLPMCFAVGFVACVTLLLSGFTAFDLLLYRQDHSPEIAGLLYDLAFGLLAMSGMPTAVALGAFAVAVYVYRVLPRYTGYLAVAAAAVHPLLLLAFVVDDGPLSLEGFSIAVMPAFLFAWILGTALAMPRKTP